MTWDTWSVLQWLALLEHELLLFAGIFFLIGAVDELAIDGLWAWYRLTGRTRTYRLSRTRMSSQPLTGLAAVFIPAWHEERVIGDTIAHALTAWRQLDLRLYVGCYANDRATLEAAMRGAAIDPRVRLVVHEHKGPTTKADCLNRLYAAMEDDERRGGRRYRMVLLHDAEDMVDAAALGLMDGALDDADFVQIPVLPQPQSGSSWVGSHYCEEFAESHGKAMVVRSQMGAGIPSAGVGCVFHRDMLGRLLVDSGARGPFSIESLTEDYELGLRITEAGGRARFLRVRGEEDGQLVATRAYFPSRLDQSVRQKGRWVHGIALQGWDRMGWHGSPGELWMRMRDRRGLISALVLLAGYLLLTLASLTMLLKLFGWEQQWTPGPLLMFLIYANLASFAWRATIRFAFTTREHGAYEGMRAVLRIPLANVIAIMAAWRALRAYVNTLAGSPVRWEKTEHDAHPARTEAAAAQLKAAA